MNETDAIPPAEHALVSLKQEIDDLRAQIGRQRKTLAKSRLGRKRALLESLHDLEAAITTFGESAQDIIEERTSLLSLADIARVINSSLDLETVLNEVMDTIIRMTGAERAFLMLRNDLGDMETVVARNWDQTSLEPGELEISSTIVDQVAKTGKSVITTNALSDPRFTGQESIIAYNLRSIMCVPLSLKGELTGVIYTDNRVREALFTEADEALLSVLADHAAVGLENARLFAEATRSAEESQSLMRTAHSISGSLDFGRVLHLIAEEAKRLLQADGSRIHLLDQAAKTLKCLVALDPQAEALMAIEIKADEGLTGHVVQTGKPLIANNTAQDPRGVQVPGTPPDEPECLALVPLQVRQHTMGVMTVRRLGTERPFHQSELNLLSAFAFQATAAIENADLYGQIQQQAQRLEAEVAQRTHDLSLSEARYRSLIETSLAGIFQVDREGRFVYVSQTFTDLLGVRPEDLLGKIAWEIPGLVEDYRDTVGNRFFARSRGERPPREAYEIELLSSSGRQFPALLGISLITGEDGESQGVTGLVMDISQVKALEEALRMERDRLNAILANIGDAVLVTDPTGTIEYVNPAWVKLNGYVAAEAIGRSPAILKSGETPDSLYAEMWNTVLSGHVWRGELVNRRKDGSTYEEALIIQPVLDPEGSVINLVGVQHDISALKAIDRLKSQFVSDVSHELRTPLTNIRLYLDLLHETTDRERIPRYLETLSRESNRLTNLIDDLLELSRLEARATPFQPDLVDLNALLTALVNDRQVLAAQSGLQLKIEPDPDLPLALADERLLTRVFTNLLTNAMNYTDEGGRITLRTRASSYEGQQWVTGLVEDTGLGIHEDEVPQVFERFFRGRASEITGAAGTGLGLSICKEIIELHQGRIEVESTPNEWTRITIHIPAAESQPD